MSQSLSKKGRLLNDTVEIGIDLIDYQQNYEWDIMSVPAKRTVKKKAFGDNYDIELVFKITIRRKTLFYSFNLIIPIVGISFLTIFVFYLPADSCEKIPLSTFIVVSITFFVPLLYESIPPGSVHVPLIAKYTLFSSLLVSTSILATIIVLNIHYRSESTHKLSNWMRILFVDILPRVIWIKRLELSKSIGRDSAASSVEIFRKRFSKSNFFLDKKNLLRLQSMLNILNDITQKLAILNEKKKVKDIYCWSLFQERKQQFFKFIIKIKIQEEWKYMAVSNHYCFINFEWYCLRKSIIEKNRFLTCYFYLY